MTNEFDNHLRKTERQLYKAMIARPEWAANKVAARKLNWAKDALDYTQERLNATEESGAYWRFLTEKDLGWNQARRIEEEKDD